MNVSWKLVAISSRGAIEKERTLFLWKGVYVELDMFLNKELLGLVVLEVELDGDDQDIELPPFLPIDKEVTDEHQYSNASLALLVNSRASKKTDKS